MHKGQRYVQPRMTEQTIERVILHQPKGYVAAYVSRKANSRDSLSLLYRTVEAFAATFGSGTV